MQALSASKVSFEMVLFLFKSELRIVSRHVDFGFGYLNLNASILKPLDATANKLLIVLVILGLVWFG